LSASGPPVADLVAAFYGVAAAGGQGLPVVRYAARILEGSMTDTAADWKVLPHGPIERLEPNLWRVEGTLPRMALRRVMTLIRLDDGRVVVHSAISLDDRSMAEIEAWGRPAVLLVPNAFHRLDAPAWVARYPQIEVRCPPGGRSKVEQVVRVDADYRGFDGGRTLIIEVIEGIGGSEAVLVVRSPGGATLVFNDALFNMPHGRGVAGFIFRYVTGSTGGPRVSRLFRMLGIKDRARFRDHLRRLSDTPDLVRIIVSHHEMITDEPAAMLRSVAAALA